MIEIKKSNPPDILLVKECEARDKGLNPRQSYQLLDGAAKKIIKKSLMLEQGGLCAYCMRRIPDERKPGDVDLIESVTIEHWIPLSDNRDVGQGLDYNNLLAVCSGNRGNKTKKSHKKGALTCDAKRENRPLKVNPCVPLTLSGIKYSSKGIISSTDPEIDADLNERLGLNCSVDMVNLPQFRKSALDGLFKALNIPLESTIYTESEKKRIIRLLDGFENETGLKTPYVGIIIWKLKEIVKTWENKPQ